ncbi:enoyl-CoA hydratase/isomerase family protein [Nocardioides sp. NPDC101246]|uniref:enoyl-CoA hydratase/isomerase family protein n=1 Tax=Nocardioides sp. NPDC101246 TaxID=3364336 RepID=UPI003803F122
MNTTTHLLVERRDGYAEVTLNRPERYNALNHALVGQLRETLEELETDPSVRAVILTGAGRAFCSGADLSAGPSDVEDVIRRLYIPLVTTMTEMSTPIVAAVNGVAAGAGFSLTLGADLRIASAEASFSLSFVKVGLVPDAGATWLLPRLVGATRAAEIALLGRKVTAAQAESWGLVNEVVDADHVLTRAREVATELAGLSASVGTIRRLLREAWSTNLDQQLDAEATAQGDSQRHPHYAEAKQAFSEKRAPRFW